MTDKTVTLERRRPEVISIRCSKASVGPDVVDIRKFYAETGMFTYDPGFTSTASCQSAITYIDGDEGILLHRGYPIDQLAEQSTFMEVAYLLLHGELAEEGRSSTTFTYTITRHTMLHEQLATFYRGFRRDAHPMAIMCGVVGALSAFYHDSTDITDPQQRHDRLAPADRQDADDRGDGLQIFDRPAVPLSRQRPQLHRQFPAHDLRRPGRAL